MNEVVLFIMIVIFSIAILVIGSILIAELLYFKYGWFVIFFHHICRFHVPSKKQSCTDKGRRLYCNCKYCGRAIYSDDNGGMWWVL